jgi:hypothetical protein
MTIYSSPSDLAPVYEAILENAHTLCDAPLGALVIYDGRICAQSRRAAIRENLSSLPRRGVQADLFLYGSAPELAREVFRHYNVISGLA